jgi:PAS domain S-box-containing protein
VDSERLLHRLVAQSSDIAIVFVDPGGRITGWSGGAAYVFGYAPEEVVGGPAAVLFPAEDREAGVDRHEMDLAKTAGAAEDDRWMRKKDGSTFWANGVLTAVRDEDGSLLGYVKLLRNRTDLKEQVEGWRARVLALEQSIQRKDIFLSTLSHELRGPLAPLANAVHLIRSTAPPHSTVEPMVKVIERQMHVLQRLVDDLLDTTRIELGKITLTLEKLTIRQVLEAAVEDLRERAQAKGHELQLILPDGEIRIEGDRERLHQVFVNLLTNAIKYTPSGGRIRVSATTEGQEAVARVEDSGIGIGAEMLPRIFELFTQVEAARGYSEGGLGIGLSLVRNFVALHGGSVQVRSEGLDKGSEFVVRLPLA